MKIRKVLIANRGEIVPRIMSSCKAMGIATVAVYSEADRDAPYLADADDTVHIGPANPVQSYLDRDALIRAARRTGADAIHPGYGFLSENAAFAQAVTTAGLVWVGPSPDILAPIHSKSACRQLARDAGVPFIPGTLNPVLDMDTIKKFGTRHGYPILLKLDKGGGGKGISAIENEDHIASVYKRCQSVGQMAFDSPDCYLEKVVSSPRHIEVQFLADGQGNVTCLGERECSIQRRHQKIIEEAPSPVATPDDRDKLYDFTRRLVKKMGYVGAGTIENLRDEKGNFYFLEINARLQVEHPVTEMVTGVDIVRQQLRIAEGNPLNIRQQDVRIDGSAIEARIYAEDPDTFMPSPGIIDKVVLPAARSYLRIDHALADGCAVPPYYDPMLAKIITWGDNRELAIRRLRESLNTFSVDGVKTSTPACLKIIEHDQFVLGDFTTDFIARYFS